MKVKKRDNSIVDFDETRIYNAVFKAYKEVYGDDVDLNGSFADVINLIKENIKGRINQDYISVEDIQDIVEDNLMLINHNVAKAYITYRYKRNLVRESNTTDKTIKEIIDGTNDYWNNENSNKNPIRATVQRDYVAGVTSTDITRRFLLPDDVRKADELGILHFHDQDYFIQHISNCCLINLEDMLQNGTTINGVMIEKPHRLITAMTIATQIITAVTSSQYGGATITLSALAPFVRDSYNRYLNKYKNRRFDSEDCIKYAKEDLKKEIEDGVQTFNYQCNSMSTTNGQAPFLSVCMYLGETNDYKVELAMLIEEFLKQRIIGLKNEVGVYITPAFPKLLYILEEDNVHKDSPYYYLTELAAKCTAKRMVPDYISEKKMLEYKVDKNGNSHCYPCINKTCA